MLEGWCGGGWVRSPFSLICFFLDFFFSLCFLGTGWLCRILEVTYIRRDFE